LKRNGTPRTRATSAPRLGWYSGLPDPEKLIVTQARTGALELNPSCLTNTSLLREYSQNRRHLSACRRWVRPRRVPSVISNLGCFPTIPYLVLGSHVLPDPPTWRRRAKLNLPRLPEPARFSRPALGPGLDRARIGASAIIEYNPISRTWRKDRPDNPVIVRTPNIQSTLDPTPWAGTS